MRRIAVVVFALCRIHGSMGFSPPRQPLSIMRGKRTKSTRLLYSREDGGGNRFDLSKPVFDLLTLRSIRGDALLRYNSLNQSEPLRINLYGLLTLTLLAFPSISEAVNGESLNTVQSVASVLAGVGSLGLFVRECQKRSRQLSRMEKELNADGLLLQLPSAAFADRPYTPPATLANVFATTAPPRILALCGTYDQLSNALDSLRIYGKRLQQASTYVLAVPTDGSTVQDWIQTLAAADPKVPWLALAYDEQAWLEYFDGLDSSGTSFRWFGLNSGGRSFGSGSSVLPQWLQLLGQHLRPVDFLDATDDDLVVPSSSDEQERAVLEQQQVFYDALRGGDKASLRACMGSTTVADEVSAVLEAGGRIDGWESCLADGARPEGMQLSGRDVLVVSDTVAYSSVVEFPANLAAGVTGSLLAIQQWTKTKAEDGTTSWRLQLHQTIPWSQEAPAQGTLLCDCRGCVALTRSNDNRRTFGGLIG